MHLVLALTVLAYLLGSIPSGLLVARALGGPDPRQLGSGNLGTANLYRLLGRKAGALTLLGDAAKGALPVAPGATGAHLAGGLAGGGRGPGGARPRSWAMSSLCTWVSRAAKAWPPPSAWWPCWPPGPRSTWWLVYILALYQTRTFSVSALICAWLLPVAVGLFSDSKAYLLLAGALSGLILVCHRENLERFFQGEEPRL